jgi:class 3 adenylate cyclase/DNA-binding SARP family transcriptional activator/tetratricopeptide (TPR) repeat protein
MQADQNRPALKAILFADLAQYSRITAAGELAALDLVTRCFALFRDHCRNFGAEFVKTTGDGVLIVFDGVSDAIDYAMSIQARLAALAGELPGAGSFRIGLHVGEVRRHDGDVFGHAVNVAARVQTQAEPGGVCVTEEAYHAARATTSYGFRFGGRPALKNIPEPVTLYHLIAPGLRPAKSPAGQRTVAVIDGLAVADSAGASILMRSQKAQALIGYLALSSGYRDVQDRIAALLWPDRPAADARKSLTGCLRAAGKAFADNSRIAELRQGAYAGLDASNVSVDVIRILDDLGEGRVAELLLHRSDWPDAILRGFERTSSLYATWLTVARHNRREQALEALEALLGRFDSSEPALRRAAAALLLLEPSHEGAARSLMRCHIAKDNAAAALRVFEGLRETLRERYRLEPSVETVALAESLAEPPPVPPPARRGRTPTIGVGPFLAASPDAAVFASGFRSELIVNLSRYRELTVIDLGDRGDGGEVDYMLKAECIQAAADLHLVGSLAVPAEQRIVWSDAYDLSLPNWASLQKQLVGKIAANLEVYLSHDRLSRCLQRLPADLGVYDLWLRGENLLEHWSPAAEDEAEALFERAIAQDASFAPAYASLASVHNSRQFIRPGRRRDAETERRALELARRAVELDPLDARNHMVVAWSAAMVQRFAQAEVHYELAVDLNPNDPKTVVSAALGLAFMGHPGRATKLLQHATAITSLFLPYQWSHIAIIRFLAGDHGGCVEAAERSQNVIIDTPGWKAAALRKLGRGAEWEAALTQLQQAAAAAWAGPAAPTRENVLRWFLAAFPLRREQDRLDLALLLGAA